MTIPNPTPMQMTPLERLDAIRSLTQNIIDGWHSSLPRDVIYALDRVLDLSTMTSRYGFPREYPRTTEKDKETL